MPDPTLIIEYSPLGIAGLALVVALYAIRYFGVRMNKMKNNDLAHIETTLNEMRDILRDGVTLKQDMAKKIDYLYTEALKNK